MSLAAATATFGCEPEAFWETVKHAVPEYTREDVDQAGDMIVNFPDLPDEIESWTKEENEQFDIWNRAYEVVDNWRASHSFPLNTFATTLRDKAHRVDASSITAQRLKRFWSIEAKLRRQKFKLSEIQDIGGCRAILKTVHEVDRLVRVYVDSDLKHKLVRTDDYLRHPKYSGYRGIHLIYSYTAIGRRHITGILSRCNCDRFWSMLGQPQSKLLGRSPEKP